MWSESAVSSHKRDRIIEFSHYIRILCAYAIGIRAFGEGRMGFPFLNNLVEKLRRRGLTDGQWVSILRELFEDAIGTEQYPIVEWLNSFIKRSKFE